MSEIQESVSPDVSAALREQLQVLRDTYASKLNEKIAQISEMWRTYLTQSDDSGRRETLTLLHRSVHSLAGSGATFGYDEVSQAARQGEIILKSLVASGQAPSGQQRAEIESAFADLAQASRQPASEINSEVDESPDEFSQEDRRLLFLLANTKEEPIWARALEPFGYDVHTVFSSDELRVILREQVPSAVLVDCVESPLAACGESGPLSGVLFEAGRENEGDLPLVWTCRQGDLSTRLEAVRLGGSAFFTQPVDVDALISRLDDLTAHRAPEPFRILIVDDEPALARLFSLILRQAGMQTQVVSDPLEIMEPLVNFRPDLILMDVYMPGCSGIELATVIRQQEAYIGIPIVFLSVETDLSRQMDAMRQGGDDFLIKPVQPRHLVAAVTTRAVRARALRALMMRDSLTGLLNHTKTKEQLAVELDRARRLGHSLALAMLDIDHFKSVNDTHGHSTGDRVLRSLARLLGQRLRQTDVIGRYGGEEFALILTGTDSRSALRVVEAIRLAFADLWHFSDGNEFQVSFSCGIATSPPHFKPDALIAAADRALYEAKRAGRNCTKLSDDDFLMAAQRRPL